MDGKQEAGLLVLKAISCFEEKKDTLEHHSFIYSLKSDSKKKKALADSRYGWVAGNAIVSVAV